MKILISIPDSLVKELDERCLAGGFSRSEYIRSLIRSGILPPKLVVFEKQESAGYSPGKKLGVGDLYR